MMGREVSQVEAVSSGHRGAGRAEARSTPAEYLLEARRLGRTGSIKPFDLAVSKGEVVGLAGLLGSGRTEAVRLLFGLDKADSGEISMDHRQFRMRNPRMAVAAGIGFCPEDRKISGIIPDLSVRENILLVLQSRRGWWRKIPRNEQERITAEYIRALNIKTADAETPIKFLSGGNQQKAILGRWLAAHPRLLILDEPTRGIDVGAKFEIAREMESLRQQGMSILFISSELEEVARSCQRVMVLRDREMIGALAGEQVTEDRIMQCIAHGLSADGAASAPGPAAAPPPPLPA
jgi:simple sugar transport system ATP-binding protein